MNRYLNFLKVSGLDETSSQKVQITFEELNPQFQGPDEFMLPAEQPVIVDTVGTTVEDLEEILGDPMIDTVGKFLLQADLCKATLTKNTSSSDETENQYDLFIPDFFSVNHPPPYTMRVFGLTEKLNNNIFITIDKYLYSGKV